MKRPPDIKALRETAGITQKELADRTGYSVSAIEKFENGRRTIPKRSLPAILAQLSPR